MKKDSSIKIPTEDGIGMQDIRLMAGEGKLSSKTLKQAIDVIRKQRSKRPMKEEAPANAAGGGNIAGLGVGAKGEPGLNTKQRLSYKRKNQLDDKTREGQIATFIRRSAPVMEETQPVSNVRKGKFAGQDTFIVPSDMFHKARNEKSKGKHWKTYIGECEYGQAIREYANKNKKNSIVLEDEKTGTMCYARYGKK